MLRVQHDLLCYTIQKISSAHQFVLFISTAFYIFELTYITYNTLQYFITTQRFWNTIAIVFIIYANLIWILLLICSLSHLAWQCEKLATEVKFSQINEHNYFIANKKLDSSSEEPNTRFSACNFAQKILICWRKLVNFNYR
jgi:hypothetical protein